MDFPADSFTEGRVDHLMPLNQPLTGELWRNDNRLKMGIVVRAHNRAGAGQTGQNGLLDIGWAHGISPVAKKTAAAGHGAAV